jgi:hypothetical protein
MAADDLTRFAAAFEVFHARLAGRLSQMPEGPERAQFQAFVKHLQGAQSQFMTEARKLDQRLDAQLKEAQAKIDTAKAQADAAAAAHKDRLAKLAAGQAAQPAREIDPALGEHLRNQVLDEYGDFYVPKNKPSSEELEWEWEWSDFLDE